MTFGRWQELGERGFPQALIINNNAMSEDVKRAVDETADSLRIEIKEVARKVKALTDK